MMWNIGDKCQCIQDNWWSADYDIVPDTFPVADGSIYVVSGATTIGSDTYLFIEGFGSLHSWLSTSFRKLTDISVFKKLERPSPNKTKKTKVTVI